MSFLVAEQNIPLALKHAHDGDGLETGKVVLAGPVQDLPRNEALRDIFLGKKPAATAGA